MTIWQTKKHRLADHGIIFAYLFLRSQWFYLHNSQYFFNSFVPIFRIHLLISHYILQILATQIFSQPINTCFRSLDNQKLESMKSYKNGRPTFGTLSLPKKQAKENYTTYLIGSPRGNIWVYDQELIHWLQILQKNPTPEIVQLKAWLISKGRMLDFDPSRNWLLKFEQRHPELKIQPSPEGAEGPWWRVIRNIFEQNWKLFLHRDRLPRAIRKILNKFPNFFPGHTELLRKWRQWKQWTLLRDVLSSRLTTSERSHRIRKH